MWTWNIFAETSRGTWHWCFQVQARTWREAEQQALARGPAVRILVRRVDQAPFIPKRS